MTKFKRTKFKGTKFERTKLEMTKFKVTESKDLVQNFCSFYKGRSLILSIKYRFENNF